MQGRIIYTKNAEETQNFARQFAEKITKARQNHALVIALTGDLGAGKTTFVQGFMREFGIKENILSPTFVVMKMYAGKKRAQHLIHIDCYRLDSPKEILHLGFNNLLRDKDAIILIEWAEKIRDLLPERTIWVEFEYGEKSEERVIRIMNNES